MLSDLCCVPRARGPGLVSGMRRIQYRLTVTTTGARAETEADMTWAQGYSDSQV